MEQENQMFEKILRCMIKIIIFLLILVVILTIVLGIILMCNKTSNEDNNKVATEEFYVPIKEETTKKPVLSAEGPSEEYYYDISYEDKVIIAKVIFAESGFEPFEGKVAVAAVILNRYYSNIPYFHKESITAVVTQPYQFASIENVTMEILEKNPSCMEAVEAACKGWDPTRSKFPKGALYFYAPALMPDDFQEGVEILSIGKVNFHYDYKLYEN